MPTPEDPIGWRALAAKATRITDAARDDPYDPQLAEAAQRLAVELGNSETSCPPATALSPVIRTSASEALLAAGQAWFALDRCEPALAEFCIALELLEGAVTDGDPKPVWARVNMARALVCLGRHSEAKSLLETAIDWYEGQGPEPGSDTQARLAQAWLTLGMAHANLGDDVSSHAATHRAVELHRRIAVLDATKHELDLSRSLNELASGLARLHRADDSVAARELAVELLRRECTRRPTVTTSMLLAQMLASVSESLRSAGRRQEAAVATGESVAMYRELASRYREVFLPELARGLSVLGTRLSDVGRRAEALVAAEEAVGHCRELVAGQREAFLADLAASLNSLGTSLGDVGRRAEALAATEEGLEIYRELVAGQREAFLPDLAMSLNDLGIRLGEAGRRDVALAATEEAVEIRRELAASQREAFLPDLATSLDNLGNRLSEAGRRDVALAATEEAVAIRRELAAGQREAFLPDLATSLNDLGNRLGEVGRRDVALAAWRECGAVLLALRPTEPHLWTGLAGNVMADLDTAQDLRDFHLPLLDQLVEHRELAWDSEHASLFLALQGRLTSRAWHLLSALPDSESDLLDEAITVLVSVLQSPELARFITAQHVAADGSLAELARLKAAVVEAARLLEVLRRSSGGDLGSGPDLRAGTNSVPTEPGAAPTALEAQARELHRLRDAFRAERNRLADLDPKFGRAFGLPTVEAIRAALRHGHGNALLCLLELPAEDAQDDPRAVGALLFADGRRSQLFELPGLSELAWIAGHLAPESDTHSDELAQSMSERLWQPLHEALSRSGAAGAPVRVHICLHGGLQQLPLSLPMQSSGQAQELQFIVWPGLPYLLRAAVAVRDFAPGAPGPWLIGHDCCWASLAPIPMAAVEAALLRQMLQDRGLPVQRLSRLTEVDARAAGLVLCCSSRRNGRGSSWDGTLQLGDEHLAAHQIVSRRLGPIVALLPACHAGETVESDAGNALGVAAAFLLGGTRLIAASSKGVPDMLMPWLSTLMLWHLLQGLPGHEATQLALRQFAGLAFPAEYRGWLQGALPQALATIQPGGEEDGFIRGPFAAQAVATAARCWPWQGDARDLFSHSMSLRQAATLAVCEGVLCPREDSAEGLARAMHHMATFYTVYGAG